VLPNPSVFGNAMGTMEQVLGTREPERRQAARREAVAVAPTEMLGFDVSEIPGETERWGEPIAKTGPLG
jgi:hypothetical protein